MLLIRSLCVCIYTLIMCLMWAGVSLENNKFLLFLIFRGHTSSYSFSLFGHRLALILLNWAAIPLCKWIAVLQESCCLLSGLSVGHGTSPSGCSLNTCYWATGSQVEWAQGKVLCNKVRSFRRCWKYFLLILKEKCIIFQLCKGVGPFYMISVLFYKLKM